MSQQQRQAFDGMFRSFVTTDGEVFDRGILHLPTTDGDELMQAYISNRGQTNPAQFTIEVEFQPVGSLTFTPLKHAAATVEQVLLTGESGKVGTAAIRYQGDPEVVAEVLVYAHRDKQATDQVLMSLFHKQPKVEGTTTGAGSILDRLAKPAGRK